MKYILLVKQSIHIIGGKYRKKKIPFPDIPNLRPTANRIRETLFNWLMHDIQGANCLDAYAGSGALGFEAISRGAKNVVLLEKNPVICNSLKNTAQTFTAESLKVINTNTCKYLEEISIKNAPTFDIVFLDPPFSEPFPEKCIEYFSQKNIIANNGLLYVEFKQEVDLNSKFWEIIKRKTTGQVTYALFRKKSPLTSDVAPVSISK